MGLPRCVSQAFFKPFFKSIGSPASDCNIHFWNFGHWNKVYMKYFLLLTTSLNFAHFQLLECDRDLVRHNCRHHKVFLAWSGDLPRGNHHQVHLADGRGGALGWDIFCTLFWSGACGRKDPAPANPAPLPPTALLPGCLSSTPCPPFALASR